jgi:hypothetical protein
MADDDDVIERLQRRALESAAADEPWEDPDILASLREPEELIAADTAPPDVTLGGYITRHDRPPAFEGRDGQPYTVAMEVEESGDDRGFVAFLIFIRWAATGAGIMDHVESGDVAYGASEESARQAAYDLSLYEVRAELDAAIERRRVNRDSED